LLTPALIQKAIVEVQVTGISDDERCANLQGQLLDFEELSLPSRATKTVDQ
jgi:hypothetical protein